MDLRAFYQLARVFVRGRKCPPAHVSITGVQVAWSSAWELGTAAGICGTIRELILRVNPDLKRLPSGWRWMLERAVSSATRQLSSPPSPTTAIARWHRHLTAAGHPVALRWGQEPFWLDCLERRTVREWRFELLGVDGFTPIDTFQSLRYLCWRDRAGRHARAVQGDSIWEAMVSLTPEVVRRARKCGRQVTALPDLSAFLVEARRGDRMHSCLGWRWDPHTRCLHHNPTRPPPRRYRPVPVPFAANIVPAVQHRHLGEILDGRPSL